MKMKYKKYILVATLFFLSWALPLYAEDGFGLSLGGGGVATTSYSGSDEYYVTPVPIVDVSYKLDKFSFALSALDGVGVSYADENSGFMASIAFGGNSRDPETYTPLIWKVDHNSETKELLKDSPAVSSADIDLMFGYSSPFGVFSADVIYSPTQVDYTSGPGKDTLYHGFQYSFGYMIPLPITEQLVISGAFLASFMDQNYADGWYSVKHETEKLKEFKAEGGIQNIQGAVTVSYIFTERIGGGLVLSELLLLGDAAKSPYSVQDHQPTIGLYAFYNFF